ncbi:MAG: polyketide cyclase [Candidatus Nitrosotenuis sp.]
MVKVIIKKIIRAERQHVFDVIANYENFASILPQYFKSIRVRSIRGNTAVVEEHLQIGSRELVMMTKHVTTYPETHTVTVIGGDAKGSRFVEHFSKIQEGTHLVVEADIKLSGTMKLAGIFGKRKIVSEFSKIIDEFARIAES